MACSAVYLGEHSRATSMHTISVQLVFEVGQSSEHSNDDT